MRTVVLRTPVVLRNPARAVDFSFRCEMFWMVMFITAGLAGVAFSWITFQTTHERLTISFETAKLRPAVEKFKQAAATALAKGREILHSRQP